MKVKGFLKDVGGASRVAKARLAAFENASPLPVREDPIGAVAREWHPGKLDLVVTDVRPASKTTTTVRFERQDGKKLPPFYAGQFMVVDFPIGESLISRPYSISSAPYQARLDKHAFVEISVRRSKGDGFICDYINGSVKVGDKFRGMIGCGQFYYEPLRDAKHVVALAGGVGITPFASMAREVAHGTLDMDLTILFGSVSSDDIALRDELDELKSDKLHVVHVLSGDEPDWTGERGFLTAELIKKYSAPDTTYFICGPQVMYKFLREELKKLDIPQRRVRFEVFGQAKDITVFEGYPQELKDKTFNLTVVRGVREDVIPAKATESLVVALERAGIRIETGCRSGECGFCRTKVLSGNVFICPESDGRRAADREFGYVHACAAYPTGDVKIKIPIE
ncbi:MAG: iron-sulfur cluster-binding domain-containing protein [Oscillospiraceae bacterium]|nr:iron-sulfur cluster-binding domain-containing protein [Oscillospiraceae bacterium]